MTTATKSSRAEDIVGEIGGMIGTLAWFLGIVGLLSWGLMLVAGALAIDNGWPIAIGYRSASLICLTLATAFATAKMAVE